MKRETVDIDPGLFRALEARAATTDCAVSDLVDDAVRQSLREDEEDIAVFDERAAEPDLPFEEVLGDLHRRGRL